MTKPTTELLTLDDWERSFIHASVMEIIKVLAAEETRMGPDYKGQLFAGFLATFVGTLVLKSLRNGDDINSKGFAATKTFIERCVAAGFDGPVSDATGRHYEYYCQVKPVPEPKGKVC